MATSSSLFAFGKRVLSTKILASTVLANARGHALKHMRTNGHSLSSVSTKITGKHGKSNGRSFAKFGIATGLVFATTAVGLQEFESDQKRPESGKHAGPLQIKATKSVRVNTDSSGIRMTLFQYQTCPFCCKVRALLDYYGFSYDIVEVNSVWRTQTKWSNYKKVPVLVVHGEKENDYLQLNDSSVIMSILETYLMDRNQSLHKLASFYPSIESKNSRGKTEVDFPNKYFIMYQDMKGSLTAEQLKSERKWRAWVDNVLVHSLSPNVYRTPTEALQAFRYFSEVGDWETVFSTVERNVVIYVGALAMYFVGKLLKKRYNLKNDVRQSLYDECKEWTKNVGKNNLFMGGDQPDLADLSMYGVLHSIQGCETFHDLLKNTNIGPWFKRMERAVSSHAGARSSNNKR